VSVSTEDYKVSYTGRVDTGPYPITFPCLLDPQGNAQDVVVKLLDSNYVETDITSICTITGLNVYTPSAYGITYTVVLLRYVDLTQPYTFPFGTKFPSKTFEAALDRLTFGIQRAALENDQSLKVPLSETEPSRLPSIGERANNFLGFDANGNPIAANPAPAGVPVTPFMETVVDDTDAATARATLEIDQTHLGISAFMQTVLDDANADTARTTLNASPNREVYTPTAGYTPALGDVVELNYDGTIRKAKNNNTAILASGSTVVGSRIARLDATHAVVIYAVGLVIKAVMVTVSLNDLSISYGTPFDVYTCTTTVSCFDVAPIDATHVLCVTAVTGGAATQATVRVLTVNVGAGTITAGNTAACGASSYHMALYPVPGSANIILAYWTSATIHAVAVISGGTTPVFNTPATNTFAASQSAGSGFGAERPVGVTVTSDSNYVLLLERNAASPFYATIAAFSLSGTTVALLTQDVGEFFSGNMGGMNAILAGPSDFVMGIAGLASTSGGGYGLSLMGVRKGGAPAWSLTSSLIATLIPASGGSDVQVADVDKAAGKFAVMVCSTSPSNVTVNEVLIVNKAGSGKTATVRLGDAVAFYTSASGNASSGLCCLSSGIVLGAFSFNTASVAFVCAFRRRSNILGVAVDNAGTVQRTGVLTGLSGLTVGPVGVDDNGNLTSVVGEARIGQALSATVLDLQVIPGV
jgi:hypothetical protein